MSTLKPNTQRANYAIIAIWADTLLALISAASSSFKMHLLNNINEGDIYTEDLLRSVDRREQLIGIAQIIATIVSIVFFILWFRRAYYNLAQKMPFLSYTDAMAAWWWFIPIFNLYKPYTMMKEMFVKTKDIFIHHDITLRQNLNTGILSLWWLLWIISRFLGQADFRLLTLTAKTMDDFIFSAQLSLIDNLFTLPLAIVTTVFIGKYAQNEPLLAQIPDKEDYNIATEYIADEN